MKATENWRELIAEEMKNHGELWSMVLQSTLSEEQLIREFDSGYGCAEGEPFTVWTSSRVYFPVQYDGAEWCGSVSRNPNGIPTKHIGGG